jgi:hypothetical protein
VEGRHYQERWLTGSLILWTLFWIAFLFAFPWSRTIQARSCAMRPRGSRRFERCAASSWRCSRVADAADTKVSATPSSNSFAISLVAPDSPLILKCR